MFIGLLIVSAGNAQNYEITANLTGFEDGAKFYLEDSELETFIDSAEIKNNRLVFRGQLKIHTPKLLFIHHIKDENIEDDESVWCNLFIGNEKVQISGDKKDFPFFLEKSGSKYQDTYNKLDYQTREIDDEYYKLHLKSLDLMSSQNSSDSIKLEHIRFKMDSLVKIVKPIGDRYFMENLNSYAVLNKLYFKRNALGKDSLQQLYNRLEEKYKKSVYGKRIKTFIKIGNIINVGDSYIDFEGIDQTREHKKLSEFIGKNYILLDFMQAFCPACVVAERELKEIQKEFGDHLQIISYNKDKLESDWKKGLKRDQPNWPSIWNGEGYFGEVVTKYGAQASPTFILLNQKGVIIDKWIGFEKGQLKEKLTKHLKPNSP